MAEKWVTVHDADGRIARLSRADLFGLISEFLVSGTTDLVVDDDEQTITVGT